MRILHLPDDKDEFIIEADRILDILDSYGPKYSWAVLRNDELYYFLLLSGDSYLNSIAKFYRYYNSKEKEVTHPSAKELRTFYGEWGGWPSFNSAAMRLKEILGGL